MYAPAQHDEITGIVNYVDEQLRALRAAVVGLTDEQARSTPTRSSLSIAGLLKHVTYGMRGAVDRLADPHGPPRDLDDAAYAAYQGSFALTADETAAATVAEFDEARVAYLAAIAATDPSTEVLEPPQPWFGIFDARPANARFYLVHQIEEMARHAGHADIIREQIDGMAVPAILMSLAGAPANDFFQPFVPAPGTLGA